ncbi:MAG: hypothetical protein JSR77_09550 [Planctomycetes bacterium]|nr:hypothetical protein [Planctomycetota bacterium]
MPAEQKPQLPLPLAESVSDFVVSVLAALGRRVRDDADARRACRALGEMLQTLGAEPVQSVPSEVTAQPPVITPQSASTQASPVVAREPVIAPPPVVAARPISGPTVVSEVMIAGAHARILKRGDAVLEVAPIEPPLSAPTASGPKIASRSEDAPDLARVVKSARIKRDACFAAAAAGGSAAAFEELRNLESRLLTCRPVLSRGDTWIADPAINTPAERARLAGECYENLSLAADLLEMLEKRHQLRPRNGLEDAFVTVAEAQSAVRNFADGQNFRDDSDQLDVFTFLRQQTQLLQIYVPNFMRRDDIADAANWQEVRKRLVTLRASVEKKAVSEREVNKRFDRLRDKVKHLKDREGDELRETWAAIDRNVSELSELGVPPDEHRVQAIIRRIDQEPPVEFAIGEPLAAALDVAEDADDAGGSEVAPRDWSATVRSIAQRLAGRELLVIGGHTNERSRQSFISTFGLSECHWPAARAHRLPVSRIEHIVRRPEVALVLRISKFSDHHHGAIKAAADAAGKPFVNLPAKSGYGVEQVAAAISEQAATRLSTPPTTQAA